MEISKQCQQQASRHYISSGLFSQHPFDTNIPTATITYQNYPTKCPSDPKNSKEKKDQSNQTTTSLPKRKPYRMKSDAEFREDRNILLLRQSQCSSYVQDLQREINGLKIWRIEAGDTGRVVESEQKSRGSGWLSWVMSFVSRLMFKRTDVEEEERETVSVATVRAVVEVEEGWIDAMSQLEGPRESAWKAREQLEEEEAKVECYKRV